MFEDFNAARSFADDFAQDNCFVVKNYGYNQIKCTAKTPSGPCPFVICFSRSQKHSRATIKSICSQHNHDLTDANYEAAQRKSGRSTSLAIDLCAHVMNPMLSLKRKPTCEQLRDLVKPFVERKIVLSWPIIQSIVRGVQERQRNGLIPPLPQLNKHALKELDKFSLISKSLKAGDAIKALSDMTQNTSEKSSWRLKQLLEQLLKNDPDHFSYRLHYTEDNLIDGIIWMSGHGRAALHLHGKVSFFDMRVSEDMNVVRYVYFAWIVLDANDQVVVAAEALLLAENDELYGFCFEAAIEMANFNKNFVELVFGDDKVKEKNVTKYLPKSRAILDFFHLCIGNNGQCIFSKTFGKHIWEELKEFMIPAAKAETRVIFKIRRASK